MGKEVLNGLVLLHIWNPFIENHQSQQKKPDTHDGMPGINDFRAFSHDFHDEADGHNGQGQLNQIEAEAEGHELGSDGGSDVCSVYDADGLGELHDSGVDKAYAENGDGSGALDNGGKKDASQKSLPELSGESFQNSFHHISGHSFKALSHHVHAVHEKGCAA